MSDTAASLPVLTALDAGQARRDARSMAVSLGFAADEAESVALAASELATNLVRYARGGVIRLLPLSGPDATGIQVESVDSGPGIASIATAMSDGYSTGGGLGGGLGAVRRLMDEFELRSSPDGTSIVARKWARHRHVPATETAHQGPQGPQDLGNGR